MVKAMKVQKVAAAKATAKATAKAKAKPDKKGKLSQVRFSDSLCHKVSFIHWKQDDETRG